MWQQTIGFNKNTVGILGWCLDYVQRGYGIGGGASTGGSSAWDSWTNYTKKKHRDRNFPHAVIIPVWFSGTWDGEYYGHVAALNTATGEVYSSPTDKQTGHQVFNSLDALIATFKTFMPDIQYVGWSEDIAGQTVVNKKEDQTMNSDHVGTLFQFMRGENPSAAELRQWTGKQAEELIDVLRAQPSAKDVIKNQQIGKAAREGKWEPRLIAALAEIKKLKSAGPAKTIEDIRALLK